MNDPTPHEIDTRSLVHELNSLATLGFIPLEKEILGTALERQHFITTLCCAAKVIEEQQESMRVMKIYGLSSLG